MMGKRQIGEMEPFELAITLVIAELACIPMADKSIPLTYGIVSILAMYVVHQIIILLSKQNKKLQSALSGTPVIVVDKKGIKYDALKSMNMQMTDLLQAMRTAGYFCLDQIAYAIFETNGQLSVVPYPDKQNSTVLPVAVIVDGQWSQTELDYYHVDKDKIQKVLQKRGLDETNVIIATLDENSRLLVYPQQGAFFEEYIDGEKQ